MRIFSLIYHLKSLGVTHKLNLFCVDVYLKIENFEGSTVLYAGLWYNWVDSVI
jgi:hypothetical protein